MGQRYEKMREMQRKDSTFFISPAWVGSAVVKFLPFSLPFSEIVVSLQAEIPSRKFRHGIYVTNRNYSVVNNYL